MILIFVLQFILAELLRIDKNKGLKEIFRKFQADTINFLKIRLSGNARLAEEIYQDAALAFIKFVNDDRVKFNSDNKIRNYLITIAMNKLKDHFKREKIVFRHFRQFNSGEEFNDFLSCLSDRAKSPEENAIDSNDVEIVQRLVSLSMLELSEAHRNILKMKFFENKSNSEIASYMNITVKAAESLLYRSKDAFKRNFKLAAIKDRYFEVMEDKIGQEE